VSTEYQDHCNANFGPEDAPTREQQEGDAWEYWHQRANKFEAEIQQLRIRNEKLHVIAKNVSHALMSFTPGGSEYFTRVTVGEWEDYYADADACQRRVRDRINKAEDGVRDQYRMGARLRDALVHVRKIIVEAAEAGFNCHDGDWADRLFASQAMTHSALTSQDRGEKP
jgi:hypothetical protein